MTASPEAEKDLAAVFRRLKALLKRYENPLKVRVDAEGRYDLWSEKDVVIDGRKRREVFFASLIIQKGYVGFYFMPVYADAGLKELFRPGLLKLLKGKSCFHIKALDAGLEEAVGRALKKGYALYKKRGWV
ncbi:MAG: DUF1801 domain-containing protein [Candidatus Aminicenantes bacterium]|nr:DUF1801 domain-containing protein [Candidatus Aminicenantes bacterium]